MKKALSKLLVVIICLALIPTTVVGCEKPNEQAKVKSFELNGVSNVYYQDESVTKFDYSTVKVEVTYENKQTKTFDLTTLEGAEYNKDIDMSVLGEKTLKVTYQGLQVEKKFSVKSGEIGKVTGLNLPQSYTDYLYNSTHTDDAEGAEINDANFKIGKNPYKVGTVNKFIFRPSASNAKGDVAQNVKTVANFSVKDSIDGEYTAISKQDESKLVTYENNTYQFSNEYVNKFVKMELNVDTQVYEVAFGGISAKVAEFQLVDGYNVYDAKGLSVYDNMNNAFWADLKDVQLEADSKKLSEYTDVKLVILHNQIQLTPEDFPDAYFWKKTDQRVEGDSFSCSYDTALQNLAGNEVGLESKLEGSLKNGEGNGQSNRFDWQDANVQKGLYSTTGCSLSGNYQSISIAPENTQAGAKNLNVIVSYETKPGNKNKLNYPITHWSVFLINQSKGDIDKAIRFEDVSLTGNNPHVETDGQPAGLMMMRNIAKDLTLNNVIANKFYTTLICDSGISDPQVLFSNIKLFDNFSNMIYMWRAVVTIRNSTLKDCGGPIFIMCDGERFAGVNEKVGCKLDVDTDSELQSYCTGTESWYTQWDATAIVNLLKANLDPALNAVNNTFVFKKENNEYLNVIALMTPQPSLLMSESNKHFPAGQFIEKDSDENIVNFFDMYNQYMFSENQMDLTAFGMGKINCDVRSLNSTMLESGANTMALMQATIGGQSTTVPCNPDFMNMIGLYSTPLASMNDYYPYFTNATGWATTSTDKVCIYTNSNPTGGPGHNAPYFGLVLGLQKLAV